VRDDERLVRIARIVESEVNGDDLVDMADDDALDTTAPEID
jgi:hypothetical protein